MEKEVMEVKFFQIKPGTIFSLSKEALETGKYLNVKINGQAIYNGENCTIEHPKIDTKIAQENAYRPFNVINLVDGSPRTFHDDNMIFVSRDYMMGLCHHCGGPSHHWLLCKICRICFNGHNTLLHRCNNCTGTIMGDKQCYRCVKDKFKFSPDKESIKTRLSIDYQDCC